MVRIPRYLKIGEENEKYSLHFFSDESMYAYAAIAFLGVETNECVKVQLLCAKSRVSPTGKKETTIARLELLAAPITARLAFSITQLVVKEDDVLKKREKTVASSSVSCLSALTKYARRFRFEYLGSLVQRPKLQKWSTISVGDVVLTDNQKRINWPLGRVIEIISGKEGITRLVRLRNAHGEMLRPTQWLFQLEITCQMAEEVEVKV
ncbi:integrase catalytic domain-containing protein [Nephila pilipes]|uniref:Integrase catalytic domain-containing protein n=1 Tax=Nephila pilipes TaxID=299642 RepID=A0A8X6PW73_NEPPI|nr:integrase catalytic domain-containing protein [Nephila pilipes]